MTPFFVEDDAEGEPTVWRILDVGEAGDIVEAVLRKLSLPDDLWQIIVDAIKAPAPVTWEPVCAGCGEDIDSNGGVWWHEESGSAFCHERGGPVASPSSPAASAVTEQGEALPPMTDDERAGLLSALDELHGPETVTLPAALLDDLLHEADKLAWVAAECGAAHDRYDAARKALAAARAPLPSVPEETPNHEH